MKEYMPSGKTPEELAAEIKKLEEESENMPIFKAPCKSMVLFSCPFCPHEDKMDTTQWAVRTPPKTEY